jgi:thioredoxin-related protein
MKFNMTRIWYKTADIKIIKKMKRVFLVMSLYLLFVSRAGAQTYDGIHFEQGLSWTQVKEKVKNEHKYIFVDCYASWCGPCKAMDKDIYPNEMVGNYMNEHFVSVKMQMDTSQTDNDLIKKSYGDAHAMMQDYKVNAFPTYLFFSPDGNIVHKEIGGRNVEDFIGVCNSAMDPNKQYYSLLEKFNQGKLDTSYMKTLARASNAIGDKELAGKIANDYINQLPEEDLYKADDIWFMIDYTTTSKNRGFSIFRNHADRIHQAVGIRPEDLKGFLENIIYKEELMPNLNSKNGEPDWDVMQSNVKKYDSLGEDTYRIYKPGIIFKSAIEPTLKRDPDWNKILPVIKRQHAGKGEEFLVGSSVVYYLNSGLESGASNDCKNFMLAATYYFKNYYSYLTADPLNMWAWTVFQRSSDIKELERALIWSDSSLKLSLKPNAGYFDTYANLLYKLGKTREAVTFEKRAATLAPFDKEIQNNFSKMKKGEQTW